MAKGVFTPTELAEVQVKLDQMWKEPQNQKFYTAKGETIKAIKENQTVEFPELKDPSKEKEIAVKWADWCDDTAVDVTNADSCTVGDCDEPDPKTQTYAPNTFIQDCFTVRDEDFQTSVLDQQEVVAKGLLAKTKNIIERFNAKAVAFIDANKGVNPFLDIYEEGVDGDTEVPKQDFTIEKMYPYWVQMLALLRSGDNFILDGRNLFQAQILAMAKKANADGKLDAELWDYFPYYNDILGFSKAGVPDNTYLIDKGALAVQTRQKYPRVPREYNGLFTDYSIPLPGYPGMGLDVRYRVSCSDNSINHSWTLKLRALLAINPFTCDAGNTGIQSFKVIPNV